MNTLEKLEDALVIGYDSGKDIYGIQRDRPYMSVGRMTNDGNLDIINLIWDDEAVELHNKLIGINEKVMKR